MSLHQHEIVVLAGLGERALERLGRALAVAAIKLLVGADHALGRIEQTLAGGIVADIGDQRAHRGFGLLARRTVGDGLRRGADMIAEWGIGALRPGVLSQGLTMASIGLSVRPEPRQVPGSGCVTGGPRR